MPVAFLIEALLMGAKSGYPACNFFANGAPGNRRLARRRRSFNQRFKLFKFDHGGRGGVNLRIRLRLLTGDRLHKRHCLRD
ncbi:MAG: hypothetical protein JWR80_9974 [Bradyrhizobium sp.]|nr:hypothetical protein [Bradyrhizobium sp.]